MRTSERDRELLRRAIDLAGEAGEAGNRPFGSVIAVDGIAVAEGRNQVGASGDITAHAELVALRRAIDDGYAERLAGATVYASGEPCPMCAAACVWAGVGRIVFAASTAALIDRRLVWNAKPSITRVNSPMRLVCSSIRSIAAIACATTSAPLRTT